MNPKLFLGLLLVVGTVYFTGVGMTAVGGGEPPSSRLPQSSFVESILAGLLRPLRDPLPLSDVQLDTGTFSSTLGVSLTGNRIRVPGGSEPRFVRLRVKSKPGVSTDDVRCADLALTSPRHTPRPPHIQSRYWDLDQKQPGPISAGWDRSAPSSFDPQKLKDAAGEDPYPDAKPNEREMLRLAVRNRGGVLDLRIISGDAVDLEIRN